MMFICGLIANPVLGSERRLEFEVVDESGDWTINTPMLFKTEDSDNQVKSTVNATNINATNTLYAFQYFKVIFDYVEFESPDVSRVHRTYNADFHINFTDANFMIDIYYQWDLHYDTGVVLYSGTLNVNYEDSEGDGEIFYKEVSTYEKSHQLEIQIWRTKTDQLGFYYKLGQESTESDMDIFNVISDWDLGNFTYYISDDGYPMSGAFTLKFEDFSLQSGSDEGIQDPIENEDWGFFEPIRQILISIVNIFVGLIRVILPSSLEDLFDALVDALGEFAEPFSEFAIFIFENFLDLLILGNLMLLVGGFNNLREGNISGILQPFWSFWGFIFNIVISVVNFIIAVIKAFIEALPI